MKIHKTLLIGVFAATSLVGLSVPTIASAHTNAGVHVYFGKAPPPSRYERMPAPRRGYVWINGYWDIKRNRHVWHPGHWERVRPGHYYAQPTWVQRNRGWELHRGEWRRDRDRDGIPNRYDRDRDGDGVPNRYDRDRDGDGVSNRRDDAPNNPRRR
jgi:hypothetical protein